MGTRKGRHGFTLIELLVVMTLILILTGFLMSHITRIRIGARRAQTKGEIAKMMIALEGHFLDFDAYPPGGTDLNDDGDLDDAGEDLGSGKIAVNPQRPTLDELQLRAIATKLTLDGERVVGPYYSPHDVYIRDGRMIDVFGNPFRYLADGRRTTINPATGERMPGRVHERKPVIWSVGPDRTHDPENDHLDNNDDGKVDDKDEMTDDVGSWY